MPSLQLHGRPAGCSSGKAKARSLFTSLLPRQLYLSSPVATDLTAALPFLPLAVALCTLPRLPRPSALPQRIASPARSPRHLACPPGAARHPQALLFNYFAANLDVEVAEAKALGTYDAGECRVACMHAGPVPVPVPACTRMFGS